MTTGGHRPTHVTITLVAGIALALALSAGSASAQQAAPNAAAAPTGSGYPAAASVASEPAPAPADLAPSEPVRATVFVMLPFTSFHTKDAPFSYGGVSAALTLYNLVGLESGVQFNFPDSINADGPVLRVFARAGLHAVVADGREREADATDTGPGSGWAISVVGLAGYRYRSGQEERFEHRMFDIEDHALTVDAGADFTYWFSSAVGLRLRPLGHLAVTVYSDDSGYCADERDPPEPDCGVERLDGGGTLSIGLTF